MVSTLLKRSQLRRIYRQTPSGEGTTYASLLEALEAFNDSAAGVATSGAGGAVVETSANGHSIRFSDANSTGGVITPADLAEMSGQLLDLYDSAFNALVAAGEATTDPNVYLQMLAELQPAYASTPDFSNLHYARQ